MIIGHSPVMMKLIKVVTKVAKTDANVLITGENGTGKEMLAREIHRLSLRSGREMVNVDMGAVSESLFESELFGHERGAFTDARESRPGKFEAAHGSTLFLDEIGNLPLGLQAKLLAALQNREVTRLGSNRKIPVDIRLIAATTATCRRWWLSRFSVKTCSTALIRYRSRFRLFGTGGKISPCLSIIS